MTAELPMPGLPERGESLPPADARRCTGETFAKQHPQDALQAEKLCRDGASIRKIADQLKHSRPAIRAYLESRGLLNVDPEDLKKVGQRGALVLMHRVADDPDSVPIENLAITAKLFHDIALSASGAPSMIVRHEHEITIKPPTAEEIQRFRQTGFAAEKTDAMAALGDGSDRPPPLFLDVPFDRVPATHGGEQLPTSPLITKEL